MSYADRVERIQPSLTLKINAEAAAIQADHRGDEAVVPRPCWVTYPVQVTLAEALLHKAGVAVVPGSGFGAPGRLRVSFAADMNTIETGLRRLREFLR